MGLLDHLLRENIGTFGSFFILKRLHSVKGVFDINRLKVPGFGQKTRTFSSFSDTLALRSYYGRTTTVIRS